MADNLTTQTSTLATIPTSAVIATDDVAGVHYQIVKLAHGAADSVTLVSSASGIPTSDTGPAWTSSFGVSAAAVTSANMSAAAVAVTDAPTLGQKIVVDDIILSTDTAMRVDLKEETSGTIKVSLYLPANGIVQITTRSKFKLGTADKKLQVQTSVAGNIAITTLYHSEA